VTLLLVLVGITGRYVRNSAEARAKYGIKDNTHRRHVFQAAGQSNREDVTVGVHDGFIVQYKAFVFHFASLHPELRLSSTRVDGPCGGGSSPAPVLEHSSGINF
jgi:hypothetical protein